MSASVYQGDSVQLDYRIDNRNLSDNWRCRVQVKANIGSAALISQDVALRLDATAFNGILPTAELPPGSYFVYAQLDNPETGESKELRNRLIVRAQGFNE